ncbi:MAG: putative signal transducing protein [Solirubrobacterales bacterium]
MKCEHCGTILSPGVSTCPGCHAPVTEDWLCLRVVFPPEDAVLKSMLEDFGIPVLLKYEGIAPVQGLTIGPLAEVRVLVPAARFEEAEALLQSVKLEGPEGWDEAEDTADPPD